MMCNSSAPLILRIYGRGRPCFRRCEGPLSRLISSSSGTRQIFDIRVDSVQTSCGWGVPVMTLDKERATLTKYHAQADPVKWVEKFQGRTRSIDGLPARPTDRYIAGPETPH